MTDHPSSPSSPSGQPGHARQGAIRNVARVLVLVFGAIMVYTGYVGLHAMFTDPFAAGERPWMLFITIVAFFLTAVSFQAGFGGAVGRYYAGEMAPVAKDTVDHVLGDRFRPAADQRSSSEATGPFCSKCGVRQDAEARFCDACGHQLT